MLKHIHRSGIVVQERELDFLRIFVSKTARFVCVYTREFTGSLLGLSWQASFSPLVEARKGLGVLDGRLLIAKLAFLIFHKKNVVPLCVYCARFNLSRHMLLICRIDWKLYTYGTYHVSNGPWKNWAKILKFFLRSASQFFSISTSHPFSTLIIS